MVVPVAMAQPMLAMLLLAAPQNPQDVGVNFVPKATQYYAAEAVLVRPPRGARSTKQSGHLQLKVVPP